MSTIHHIATLFEYDGPQLFEAQDDQGGCYLALMVDNKDGVARHLVVKVTPDRLAQFHDGGLDLRALFDDAAKQGWYLADTSDLRNPLVIEPQTEPLPNRYLPDEGFALGPSAEEDNSIQVGEEAQPSPPTDSKEVRDRLVRALRLDLIGPGVGHELAAERLPEYVRPSNWYLTGFLIPTGTPAEIRGDADEDDDVDVVPEALGLEEESTEERKSAKKAYFPSSMGLSFLVRREATTADVSLRWGDYERTEVEGADGKPLKVWQRTPNERTIPVTLRDSNDYDVPDSRGLKLNVAVRPIETRGLVEIPAGSRSVSVFLVNQRTPNETDADAAYAFQAEIEIRAEHAVVPRPDPQGAWASAWDDQVADLHYADMPEYATGHGVSADWELVNGGCRVLRSTWIPSATVERTETVDVAGAELDMETLGELADGAAAELALQPLVEQYRQWIEARRTDTSGLNAERRETADALLQRAGHAADRMDQGITALAGDDDALDAFRTANRAVALALRQRLRDEFADEGPSWRAFQLAFILLNLPGVVDPRDPGRQLVDLLFFPTGGGKTEAYLGLAAFAMVLRRLRGRESPGAADNGRHGAGVAVIMRYTLRLLTLDQLARASGLVCALELEREDDPDRYGEWPFEIGLWVGKAATPNHMGRKGERGSDSARSKTNRFKSNPSGNPSPIPLENCPWCGTRFEPDSFNLLPNSDEPKELRIACTNFDCEFSERPLPIVAVDESIYRRLPAFLIATVDKFASLPWRAETGGLLGGADRYDASGFYNAAEPRGGTRLAQPLGPPDLVIQDELHLISGPLGTMVGLYETAIEALCVRDIAPGEPGAKVRPKIVASTATARQAGDQIQSLFGRAGTEVFPPPGPNRRDSFFARTAPVSQTPGRLYLGVAATGRNPKVVMRRTWLALMGAAERAYRDAGGHRNDANPADPYMTVLGYFNSLRELGGARRILEEEVRNTIKKYGERRRVGERRGLFQDRRTFSDVVELTSRVSTDKVAQARRRLESPFHERQRVDCAIATNMISVGLDIQRLGLMVVLSQPKTHAEYIQATSRVGRDEKRPGLVVTLLNAHKPRDRSHYERFRHYHETFYRSVEVSSVTPFSARALDRGFAGAMVGLARHAEARLTPPRGVEEVEKVRAAVERKLIDWFQDRVKLQPIVDEAERNERLRSVQNRVVDLLDSWLAVVGDYHEANTDVQYQRYEHRGSRPLLREMLDKDFETNHHAKFRANRSLRDVEPQVNLRLLELTPRSAGGAT